MAVLMVGRKAGGQIRRTERNMLFLFTKYSFSMSSLVFFKDFFLYFPILSLCPSDDPGGVGGSGGGGG